MKKHLVLALVAFVTALGLSVPAAAFATDDTQECVPSDAWTETIEHPEVSHVVHHEAVTHTVHHDAVTHVVHHAEVSHVVHHDAVTHEETVVDSPAVWANWSPNDTKGPQDYTPIWPTDDRGTWHVHNQLPPGHEGPDGVYQKGGGNSDWFYRSAEKSHTETVVDHEAYDETVIDSPAYDEVVVDEEGWDEVIVDAEAYDETVVDHVAYTETIEHPAVTCEEPVEVTPNAVGTPDDCDKDPYGQITVTTVEGVTYTRNGTEITGTVDAANDFDGSNAEVKATLAEGYVLAEGAVDEWSFDLSNKVECPLPPKPAVDVFKDSSVDYVCGDDFETVTVTTTTITSSNTTERPNVKTTKDVDTFTRPVKSEDRCETVKKSPPVKKLAAPPVAEQVLPNTGVGSSLVGWGILGAVLLAAGALLVRKRA